MALASIAAAPRSCLASPCAGATTPFPPPLPALSTSSLVTFDPGPDPLTEARSTPLASATLRARGVAFTSAAPLPPPPLVPPLDAPPVGDVVGGTVSCVVAGDGGSPAAAGPAGRAPCPSPS